MDGIPGQGQTAAMEVSFETIPSGATGQVRVPLSGYSASEVDAIIEPLAIRMEQVAAL